MPVKLKCSGCETVLTVPDAARGKVVKCKSCGKALKVPAGTAATPPAKKKAAVVSNDTGEFIAGLDLDRLEDRNVRLCPKCAAAVGPEDIDCPMCGADLTTGGRGTAQRARHGRKGAAPSEYYGKALKDAGRFLVKKQGLAWKSFFVLLLAALLVECCLFMIFYSSHTPPRVFWSLVLLVPALMPFGWGWHLQNQLVRRALNPKLEKDAIHFEFFTGVSLGIKTFAWLLAFAFPFWLLLAAPGLLMSFASGPLGLILIGIGAGLAVLTATLAWPVVSGHMAMPVSTPGWLLWKAYGDVGRNLGPSLFWATFAFLTALPLIGVLTAAGFFALPDHIEFQSQLAYNGRIDLAKNIVESDDAKKDPSAVDEQLVADSKLTPKEVDYSLMIWPLAFLPVIALVQAPWLVYNARSAALFVKMFKPNIELVGQEKEYVYVAKSLEEKEKAAKQAQTWQATFLTPAVLFALGAAGGMVYATVGTDAGYLHGLGWGLVVAGALGAIGCRFTVIGMAFQESPLWGFGTLFIDIVWLAYVVKNWAQTKYAFVSGVLSVAFVLMPGAILIGVAAARAEQAAAPAAPAAAVVQPAPLVAAR